MSASTRPIKLDEWGISWEEYKELTYFCLQYNRKKADAAALLTIKLSTPTPAIYHKKVGDKRVEFGTFLPHGSGRTSDPVASTAAKRDRLLNDIRMIEQAARGASDAARELYKFEVDPRYIIRAVTQRSGVQALYANPDTRPPMGERQFYTVRRIFYWILHEMRNGDLAPIS
jgi:hypothetical protein